MESSLDESSDRAIPFVRVVFLGLVVVVGAVVVLVTRAGSPEATSLYAVIFTDDDGFQPTVIGIGRGDTVVFVNASNDDFWPASNIHPTHGIRPEFDPLQPIPPGQAWMHTFDEPGAWAYHDHLDPVEGGLVSVTGIPPDDLEPLVIEMPDTEFVSLPPDAATAHIAIYTDDQQLERFIERYGPAGTLRVLKQIELNTNGYCHDRAHKAGSISYELFGPAAFVLVSHECQSGGIHGATEALFADRGTANLVDDIAALCDGTINPFIRYQCFHGSGHGLMAWTNYSLPHTLALCDSIPLSLQGNDYDRQSCYAGVYMENVVGGLSGLTGHYSAYLRDNDPIYPCDIVEIKYQPACYFYQTSHMARVLDYDMVAVAALCTEAPKDSQTKCFGSYGRDAAAFTFSSDDPETAADLCGNAEAEDHIIACVQGAAQNLLWEETNSERSVAFCALFDADPQISQRIRDACYITITERASNVFSTQDKLNRFCSSLPTVHQPSCRSPLSSTDPRTESCDPRVCSDLAISRTRSTEPVSTEEFRE